MGVKLLGKIKIHEIAKKVGLASKEVIEKARELGIAVTSHLSTIENEQAEKLEQALDDGRTKNIGKKEKKIKTTILFIEISQLSLLRLMNYLE